MRSKPPNLQQYLTILDEFLLHCRRQLSDAEWETLIRRLTSAPVEYGYTVQAPWTPREFVDYYWRKFSTAEQRAWLREHRRTRQPQEVV